MTVSDSFWLTVTNIALGVVVALFVLGTAFEVLHEAITRLQRRHRILKELDRDMEALFRGKK